MDPRVGLDTSTPGFDPRTVQSVAIRYTNCAIPAHGSVTQYKTNTSCFSVVDIEDDARADVEMLCCKPWVSDLFMAKGHTGYCELVAGRTWINSSKGYTLQPKLLRNFYST